MAMRSSGLRRSSVRKPGHEPAWPTNVRSWLRHTRKPRPRVTEKSGSTQCTRCISRSVLAASTSVVPVRSRRNCQLAKRARSAAEEANPAAGPIPSASKNGITARVPSRLMAP
jgi:hypothetical protein